MMESKPLEASQLVRGRGRPPKDPTKGMRRNCTFRLPDNTRDKLLLAAVASNRTLSEEIEWRVEQWVALQEREAALKEREAALQEHEGKLKAREERLAGLEGPRTGWHDILEDRGPGGRRAARTRQGSARARQFRPGTNDQAA